MKKYLSLIKFSHTIFAMPFACVGFGLGITDQWGSFQDVDLSDWIWKGLGVVACMVFARSAAMAFNRYLDRNIDAMNPRTSMREIPAGLISPKRALTFTLINSILFVAAAGLINPLCFLLSPVALLVVLGYSYTKRFTALCHLILGIGLSLSVIGAYLAVTGSFSLMPLLFSFVVLTWVSGFDILYAMQDESFDRTQALHSVPAWVGGRRALLVSSALHFLTIAALFLAGIWGDLGLWYWMGVLIFTSLLIYQHALVSADDLSRIDLAFMTTNGIGSVVFALFFLAELIFTY
ncbi:MAG: UbiA-like polyprenyltransferase [Bacteroidota bacterium]|jgi:4-hydroxybenzoate polyprenyltransferase